MQISEEYILAALCDKKLWDRYAKLIHPNAFSEKEVRDAFVKLCDLQIKQESGTRIDPSIFTLELPDLSVGVDEETVEQILLDFTSRLYLNKLTSQIITLTNKSNLVNSSNLDTLGLDLERARSALSLSSFSNYLVKLEDLSLTKRYLTGLNLLDNPLQGIAPGEMFLLVAPPHGGKTHWLVTLATQYLKSGHDVVHFFLEDIPSDVIRYYQQALGTQKLTHYLENNLRLVNYSGIPAYVSTLGKMIRSLEFEPPSESSTEGSKTVDKPLVIVVDYADLLQSWDAEGERFRVTDIYKALRRLSNKNNAILLTATQGDADTFEKKYPTMRDLSEAKIGKAGTADIIVFWSQMPEEKAFGRGRLVIAKARGRKLSEPIIRCCVNWDDFTVKSGG